MKFSLNFLISFSLIFLVASCSQKPAQIVNRSKNIYNKNSELNKKKYSNLKPDEEKKYQAKSEPEQKVGSHQIEVGAGETLYSLAKKYQVTLRDLVAQNNLTPPYILKSGTSLTIPAPNYHEVQTGETLYAISRSYNMKIDDLIAINDLKQPYGVKVGEKIRIAKLENLENSSNDNLKTTPTKKAPIASIKSPKNLQKTEEIAEKKSEESLTENVLSKSNKFSWPVRGAVVSKFGPKSGGLYNDGINIKGKEGAEVKASESGVAAYVGNELKGYGNLVIIKHSGGWITAYAHLSKMLVSRGQKVAKGEKIGLVGSSGNVTSPQLYFGLRKGRDAVNPENYLK
jgi:murein DD-endopeptidase MepM/ murein hydrolase activator NlpD